MKHPITLTRRGYLTALALLGLLPRDRTFADQPAEPTPTGKSVLIVVGPSNHPPGTHEVAAGGRVMEFALQQAAGIGPIRTRITTGWPHDEPWLDSVDTVVFIGDEFPPHKLPDSERIMGELTVMMDRGCGIACIHFATGLREPDVAPDGEHPLLHWMGGYFASRCSHHKSIARIFPEAEILPATSPDADATPHPVLRGWQAFTLNDEPYIENYFGPPGHAQQAGLIEFAVSMLPPEAPRRQVVAWGIERPDGGRGFGIVMPHYYRNWRLEDLRTLILNGIVWSAGADIPAEGVRVDLPDLSTFEPAGS